MKATLNAGEQFETISPSEMGHLLHPIRHELAKLNAPVDTMRISTAVIVPASGIIAPTVIYTVPTGRLATVHRIAIDSGSATPLVPIAAGWLRFGRDGTDPSQLCYFLPTAGSTAIAPTIITEGNESAVMLRSGQTMQVNGAGLAAGLNLSFSVSVQLWHHNPPAGSTNYGV